MATYRTRTQEIEVRVFKDLQNLVEDMQKFAEDFSVRYRAYGSPNKIAIGFACVEHDIRWQISVTHLRNTVHGLSDSTRELLRTERGRDHLASLILSENFDVAAYSGLQGLHP